MSHVENEIYEYICDLNCTRPYCVDIRFTCFGDSDKFYTNSGCFKPTCVDYVIDGDVGSIKAFFTFYLEELWSHRKEYHNRIALLIDDISKQSNGYVLSVGTALFEDPTVTKDQIHKEG